MSTLPLWGYLVVLAGSLFLSLLLVPLALSVALKFGVLDHPGPAKSHDKAVPYLGGTAIVVSFALVVIAGNALDPPPSGLPQLGATLGLGVVLAVMGLIDDIRRRGLSPWLRLALEVAAAVTVWLLGSNAYIAGFASWANGLVSVLWIVGITNAFNLLDNMDGLSAGTATIACLGIFGVAALQHRYLVAALALAVAGCAAGFLRSNFHPARIYMGDAGSLFLGFVIAVLLLKLRSDGPTRVPVAVILAIPGVAIFDTTLVVTTRILKGRSPLRGGRDHTSHRLVHLGLKIPHAVGVVYAIGIALGTSGVVMSEIGPVARVAGLVTLVVSGAAGVFALARVNVDVPANHRALITQARNATVGITAAHTAPDGASPPSPMTFP